MKKLANGKRVITYSNVSIYRNKRGEVGLEVQTGGERGDKLSAMLLEGLLHGATTDAAWRALAECAVLGEAVFKGDAACRSRCEDES